MHELVELAEHETDPDFVEMAEEDYRKLLGDTRNAEQQVAAVLVPEDKADMGSAVLEVCVYSLVWVVLRGDVQVRAGTGGDEASLFVGDIIRMYQKYAALCGWSFELLSETPSSVGGFKVPCILAPATVWWTQPVRYVGSVCLREWT